MSRRVEDELTKKKEKSLANPAKISSETHELGGRTRGHDDGKEREV